MADSYLNTSGLTYLWGKIKALFNTKQDTLVSGTSIKTINGTSLLGSGDLTVGGSGLSNITDSATGVAVSGDVQTSGDVSIVDSTFPTSTPANNYYSLGNGGVEIKDGDDARIGYFQGTFATNGYRGVNISATRTIPSMFDPSNPETFYNGLSMYINGSGSSVVYVDSPSAWRSALEITPANIGAASTSALSDYVLKAGATMTGDLSIQKSAGAFTSRSTNINGQIGQTIPSSNTGLGGNFVVDNQGNRVFSSEVIKSSADDLYRSYVLQREDTGGNNIHNGFYLHIDASGTKTVTFDSTATATAWRTAIGAQATLTAGSNISISGNTISATDTKYTASTTSPYMDGTASYGSSTAYARADHRHPTDTSRAPMPTNSDHNFASTSVATGTDTTVVNTGSLATGLYLLHCVASFANNSTGRRVIFLTNTSTGANLNRYSQVVAQATSGAATIVHFTYVANISSATTFYMRVYQASGSALNVTGGIQVVKLK